LVAVAAVVTAVLVVALLVVHREILHEAALGEVVPVGAMELQPLASVLAGRS